jgi:hypothetical protein
MERQLRLIEDHVEHRPEADWRLDEHTKQVGRSGVAAAREALAAARRRTAA